MQENISGLKHVAYILDFGLILHEEVPACGLHTTLSTIWAHVSHWQWTELSRIDRGLFLNNFRTLSDPGQEALLREVGGLVILTIVREMANGSRVWYILGTPKTAEATTAGRSIGYRI